MTNPAGETPLWSLQGITKSFPGVTANDNISLDLIFALPESLERDFVTDVHRVLALEPKHVSLYGLTVGINCKVVTMLHRRPSAPFSVIRF